ncbi:MAG: hypothetical protein CSA21_07080 [Deltaproteobacteria bacterium]|nr:MAG: hypothetical protein CSA21_07080 [Deltaproteobacteria bacterium]
MKCLKLFILLCVSLNMLVLEAYSESTYICFHLAYVKNNECKNCFIANDNFGGTIYVDKAFLCNNEIEKAFVVKNEARKPLWLSIASKLKGEKKLNNYLNIEVCLSDEGAKKIQEISRLNPGALIAIYIGNKLFSVNEIISEINSRTIFINGMFSEDEAIFFINNINKLIHK